MTLSTALSAGFAGRLTADARNADADADDDACATRWAPEQAFRPSAHEGAGAVGSAPTPGSNNAPNNAARAAAAVGHLPAGHAQELALPYSLCRVAVGAVLGAALCLGAVLPAQANRALAEKNNCLGCHALDTRLVGPALREVGARYAGQPDALAHVTASIRQGGSGRWGEVPMPAQAQLREADAKRLADWILKGAR